MVLIFERKAPWYGAQRAGNKAQDRGNWSEVATAVQLFTKEIAQRDLIRTFPQIPIQCEGMTSFE